MDTKSKIKDEARNDGNTMLASVVFHPILFSTPMIQAILDGRKTMTRRIVKPQPPLEYERQVKDIVSPRKIDIMPKYEIGDIFWVRETWCGDSERYWYKADNIRLPLKWKPSIFMPKEACRIWLEITEIRIEKLQDISKDDCINEGIKREVFPPTGENCYYFYPCNDLRDDSYLDCPKTSFYSLWKSINGQKSWEENPFVWVYEFKRIECPNGFR